MDEARQLEIDLLCGVIDALPCPAALLNRAGQAAYVSERECPVDLERIPLHEREDVRGVLSKGEPSVSRIRLEDSERAVWGLMELYPVRTDGRVVGALLMFHPEAPAMDGRADALPTLGAPLRDMRQSYAAEQIGLMLEAYGDSVEAKRRVADELGIGLSTLYRIMAKGKKNPPGK